MRPNLGGGGGSGMGGGGNVLRTVGRAVTRAGVGFQEPLPAAANAANSAAASSGAPTSPRSAAGHTHKLSSKNHLSLSSATSSPFSPFGVSASTWAPFSSPQYDEYEWVSANGSEDEGSVYFDDLLLGAVPSTDEVYGAVSAIQQVFDSTAYPQLIRDRFGPDSDLDKDTIAPDLLHQISSTESDLDWQEPLVHLSNSRMLQPYWPEMVTDTFNMLQTDPSVQRMVVSLSTDRAVWEAVLNNEAVMELRESCQRAETSTLSDGTSKESSNEANPLVDIVRQMFDHTKAKFMDMIEKVAKLMSDLFSSPPPPPPPAATNEGASATAGPNGPFERKLQASFMLSLVVLLIVVVSRAKGAR